MAEKPRHTPTSMVGACPHCHRFFPNADLASHTAHCLQASTNSVQVRPPVSVCKPEYERQAAPQPISVKKSVEAELSAQPIPSKELVELEPTHRTKDGYPIDKCWACRRRICLVPAEPAPKVYNVGRDNYAADKHCCDDGLREMGRVRALTYVDKRLAAVVPNEKEKKRR